MLSLAEDKQAISDIFKTYLNETPILKWKYEDALSKVVAEDLLCTNVSDDIQTLGDIYKGLVEDFPSSSHGRSVEEEAKIEVTLDMLDQIVSAPQIKKIMFKCLYKRNLQSEVLDQLIEEEEKRAREIAEKKEKKKGHGKDWYRLQNNEILSLMKNVIFTSDIKSFADGKDLLLHDSKKRRRLSQEE